MAKKKNRQLSLTDDYQHVFGSVAGKRVLNDMMAAHHMMGSTFSEVPNLTYIREGERNVLLRIFTILKLDLSQIRERIENDEKIRDNETIV